MATPRGEVLWERRADAPTRIAHYMTWLADRGAGSFADYAALWRWSIEQPNAFWTSIAEYFDLGHGARTPSLVDARMPGAVWFPELRVNFAEQALRGDAAAPVVFGVSHTREDVALTRGELRDAVARARVGLEALGVRSGDRVAGYLPNIPETVVALLATASLGAIWTLCAPELGVPSVLDRLQQVAPKVLITVDGYRYGDKSIDLRDPVARLRAALPSIEHIVGIPYLRAESLGDTSWAELIAVSAPLAFEQLPFQHPLWILFSSGTTGLPKAITHSHGGVAIELCKSHALHSELGADSRWFVVCSTSWVMWNLLVGGLLVGASIVMFDGSPSWPDDAEVWRIAARTRTTVLGLGASLVVQHRARGLVPRALCDLSSLRGVFSSGSPLPADGFRWLYDCVGAGLYVQSASGGTDICSAFVGGSPILPVRAGEIACRCLGVAAAAFDTAGHPLLDEPGELVVTQPMPSMPIYFWNDPDGARYRASYFETFPGVWRHGDWVEFRVDGSCVLTGRSDGTLNRGGIRLGSAEFYTVLAAVPEVADSLIVHLEDRDGGPGRLLLFVELADGAALDESLRHRVARALRDALSPRHQPDEILAIDRVPYNLTGKKLEVPVKRILLGAPRAAVVAEGAVRDPSALDAFVALAPRFRHLAS